MNKTEMILSEINSSGITTKKSLVCRKNLYDCLLQNISHYILDSVFSSYTNRNRLTILSRLGIDIEDIHMDYIEKIITNLDTILSISDPNHQIRYICTIGNRMIIDYYRHAVKNANSTISLDSFTNTQDHDDNMSNTLNDFIPDPKASPETKFSIKSSILEFFHIYCNNPDSLLCTLSVKILGEKPNELATLLLRVGSVDKVLEIYKKELCIRFDIDYKDLPTTVPAKKTGLTKLLTENDLDQRKISRKISKINYRTKFTGL